MNLYFRLFLMFLVSRFRKAVHIFDEFSSHRRVLPNDLDLFMHMNNGRYFGVADLARIEMLVRSGLWKELKARKLYPVMAAETIQFFRPLKLFQKYEILTRTLGWDEKYFYVEQRFSGDKRLFALMLVKVRVIGNGDSRLSPSELLGFVCPDEIERERINAIIDKWNESSRAHGQGTN